MFCKNCGAEMNENARFCANCGYDRLEGQDTVNKAVVEDNNVVYQIKPTFNFGYKLICSMGRALFYWFFITYVITGLTIYTVYPVTKLIALVIGAIYIAGSMFFENLQYKDLEYNFYNTKIEYKDGFLNKEEKELKYKFIREVTMNQSVLERIFNVGTIRVFTNASSGGNSGKKHGKMNGQNGIFIHCVTDVQRKYKEVKEVIDRGTPEE